MTDPMIIARHESSHAITARMLGIEVVKVSLDPPLCRTRWHGSDESAAEKLALVDMADICSEKEMADASADIKSVTNRCRQMAMDANADMTAAEVEIETAILFWQLGVRAAGLVDDHADTIDAVAAELVKHGELDGDAIDRIMEQR